jgi:hypothetical protein
MRDVTLPTVPVVQSAFRSRLAVALALSAAAFAAMLVGAACGIGSATEATSGSTWLALTSLFEALGAAALVGASAWLASVLVRVPFRSRLTAGPLFVAGMGFVGLAIASVFDIVWVVTTLSGYSPASWAIISSVLSILGYLVVAGSLAIAARSILHHHWTPPRAVMVLVIAAIGFGLVVFSHIASACFYGHLDRFETGLTWQSASAVVAAFATAGLAAGLVWAARLVGRPSMTYQSLALPLVVVATSVFVGLGGDTLALLSGITGWDLASSAFSLVSDVVEIGALTGAIWALGHLPTATRTLEVSALGNLD